MVIPWHHLGNHFARYPIGTRGSKPLVLAFMRFGRPLPATRFGWCASVICNIMKLIAIIFLGFFAVYGTTGCSSTTEVKWDTLVVHDTTHAHDSLPGAFIRFVSLMPDNSEVLISRVQDVQERIASTT